MNYADKQQHYAVQLPNEEVAGFYGELFDQILHDERSYGPNAFTTIISSSKLPDDDNPRRLFLSVFEQTDEDEKAEVMFAAFDYFRHILETDFPSALINTPRIQQTPQVVSEEDLPF